MTTRLLAVDDSKTMRKVLEITFAGEDYTTVLAESSRDALAKLGSENPTVALVDANLGGESGYDLCQQIKSQAPGVQVLILSSKQQPYDQAKGSAAGADDFMDKPFDTQQLIDKVGALVRKAAEAPAAKPVAAQPAAPAPVQPAAAAPAAPSKPAPLPTTQIGLQRPRTDTLGYGSPAQPKPAAAPAPARPAAPTPVSGTPLGAKPAAAHTQPMVSRPAAPAASPPAPQVAPAPAAKPAAAPAPAPARAPEPAAPPAAAAPAAAAPAAAAATAGDGQFAEKLQGLGLSQDQVQAVLALSREVVEQVVWEVVPVLAETMIKEEIRRLTGE